MTLKAVVDNSPSTPAPPSVESPAIQTRVDIRSVSLTVLAGLAVVLVLQYAQAMIIPIVLAVLISYALEPMGAWMARRVPRPPAAAGALALLARAAGCSRPAFAGCCVRRTAAARPGACADREDDGRPPQRVSAGAEAATELEKAANAAAPPTPRRAAGQMENRRQRQRYVIWGSLHRRASGRSC